MWRIYRNIYAKWTALCDEVLHSYIDFAFRWALKTLIIADSLETQPDQKQNRVAVTHLISSLLHVNWKWNYSQKYLPSLFAWESILKLEFAGS